MATSAALSFVHFERIGHCPCSRRWLLNGQLVYAPVGAVEASSNIGVAAFMDFFSITNTVIFLRLLAGKRGSDVLSF